MNAHNGRHKIAHAVFGCVVSCAMGLCAPSLAAESANEITSSVSSIEASNSEARVAECVNRLSEEVVKAFADAGLTIPECQNLFGQQSKTTLTPKQAAFVKAVESLKARRQPAIDELAALGPSAVPVLLRTHNEVLATGGLGDVFTAAIREMGEAAAPNLIGALADPDVEIRVKAAADLGVVGGPEAVEALTHALSDPYPGVVYEATGGLIRLMDDGTAGPLIDLWNKGGDRERIASAMGRRGDTRACEMIRPALETIVQQAESTGDRSNDSLPMRTYSSALASLRDERAIPILERMLKARPQQMKGGEGYQVADCAAAALRQFGFKVEGNLKNGGYKVVERPSSVDTEESKAKR